MPSIHPDFEYDIFISYRQNDNKRDGWVTSFVEALRDEIEATLKNPISIYFDENPHDGLLETHQVDASLAKKLKCLVFIPIISQTYCDETSFAWEHEFMPFINMAKEDELGMSITLSNGNVVSRVLPVKIHRLDIDDQNTLEAVLDGPLRSIDFIYHEPGVNRPLKLSDDRNLNLEKTDYHNQVNKVANALKDIGASVVKQADGKIRVPVAEKESPPPGKSSKKGIYIALASIVIALLSYWGYLQFYNSPVAEVEDITIAVLAFDDQSPNGDQEYLGDGIAEEIRNVLSKVNGLLVTGKTSSFYFKNKEISTHEIGEMLNVSVIIVGSVSKVGDNLRINAQLIDTESETQLWSDKFDREWGEILPIMDEVAKTIVSALKLQLSVEELEAIKVDYEVNPEAYEYFLIGEHLFFNKFYSSESDDDFREAEKMYLMAITIDSAYAEAYAGLAGLYYQKIWADPKTRKKYDRKVDSVVNLAYSINPNSAYVMKAKGESFIKIKNRNVDSAYFYFKKARDLEPGNIIYSYNIAGSLWGLGLFENSNSMSKKILMSDPLNLNIRIWYTASLESLGKYKEAKKQLLRMIEVDPRNVYANRSLLYITLLYDKDLDEAKRLYHTLEQLQPSNNKYEEALLLATEGNREAALSTSKISNSKRLRLYSILDMKEEALVIIDSLSKEVGYAAFDTYLNLQNNKIFEFIRDEPKFKEMLSKAKKVHEERVAKYGHYFDEE